MEQTLGVGSRVKHPAFGEGVIIAVHKAAYEVTFITYGVKQVGRTYDQWEIVEALPANDEISLSDVERSMIKVINMYSDITQTVEMGDKWDGGQLILKAGREELKSKEMPIDTFFHKIVMVRDRLRVMEQRINSSSLTDEEKVNLQQYITRIYGSLTSFNVLFDKKEDHFKGSKS